MAASESVYIGTAEPVPHLVVPGWIAQVFLRETPAGQGLGVTVHDSDAAIPNLCREPHGQVRQGLPLAGCDGTTQLIKDAVRALYHAVVDPFGVGAATTRIGMGIGIGQLGFNVAAQCRVGQHRLLDPGKPSGIHIEPVEVTVEDQALAPSLGFK